MDGDLPFGFQHRQKRTHAQMEGHEGSRSPTWSSFNREPSASASQPHSLSQPNPHPHPHISGLHLPRVENMAQAPPRRHPGDGLDFRRPVNYSNYVDLTADDDSGPSYAPPPRASSHSRRTNNGGSRLPRGMDIIIDLDADDEHIQSTGPGAPSSPEIQFIASRRIDPPSREASAFGRSNSDGDDVEFLHEIALPEHEVRRRRVRDIEMVADLFEMDDRFSHLRAQLERTVAHVNRRVAGTMRHDEPVAPARSRGPIIGFVTPTLDFELVGFNLMGGNRVAEPPPPTYDPPEKAPEGFTRSPEEQDVLVCPNCGEELCSGEDEVKRQVWIVKHCGHVYCGECTSNRSIKRSAKGKEKQASGKTKPFKECVVEGCDKRVSNPKAMIQVFL